MESSSDWRSRASRSCLGVKFSGSSVVGEGERVEKEAETACRSWRCVDVKEIKLENGLQLWMKERVVKGGVTVCEGVQVYPFRQVEKAIKVIYQTCDMRETSMRPSKPGRRKRSEDGCRIFLRGV